MILTDLLSALQKGNIYGAMTLARAWLAQAPAGAPESLLRECPKELRGRLALLLRDLLSRHPATVLGAPVLLYCRPDDTQHGQPRRIRLPFPPAELNQPCSDLHFLGWVARETLLPVPIPFQPERHVIEVPLLEPFAAVALFRSHPEVFDLDELVLPDLWWAEVCRPLPGTIHLTTRMLLPYPDALEAARVLHASARGEPLPEAGFFLTDNAWAWATDAGALFQESCRHWHPG